MKACPFCAEEIQAQAVKCKHCGEFIDASAKSTSAVRAPRKLALAKKENAMLGGVCGGIAEYLEQDPTLVRIGVVAAVIFSGFVPGVIAYIVMMLVVPETA